jgi:hypothetical protein
MARSLTGPNGSSLGDPPTPPTAGTANALRYFTAGWPAEVMASTSPSAVHPVTRVCGSPQKVSLLAALPSVSVRCTSGLPSRQLVQAIWVPSRENLG